MTTIVCCQRRRKSSAAGSACRARRFGTGQPSSLRSQPPRNFEAVAVHERGVAEDVVSRATRAELAAVEQQNSVAEIDDDIEIVRRDDLAAGELLEDRDQRAARPRIETAEGFVERQHARLAREDSGEANSFAFAEAQPQRTARFVAGESNGGEAVAHAPPRFIFGQAEIEWAKRDVLKDRRAKELVVGVLKQKAAPPTNLGDGLSRDGNVVNRDVGHVFNVPSRNLIRRRRAGHVGGRRFHQERS
ncbi:MAG: hypothetical protein FD138_3337 [Planctomycetota bacterium]|nr:MAG: hypothetical protein FD138_3337 [Planctomycetota bacterium]